MSHDHEEIRALIHAYADCIDEGDLEGVADLFAHARIVAGNGQTFEGRDQLLELWRNSVILHDGATAVCHLITNLSVVLDPDDADRASASSYVTVMQALPGFPLQPIAVSRHQDRFERVDGTWRFTERRDRQVLMGDLRNHMVGAPDPAAIEGTT